MTSLACARGGVVTAAGHEGVKQWRLHNGEESTPSAPPAGPTDSPALSADSGLHAVAGEDGMVQVTDLSTGTVLARFRAHPAGQVKPILSADGRLLATYHTRTDVQQKGEVAELALWQARTGEKLGTLTPVRTNLTALALSPDGQVLAAGDREGKVRLWDLATRQERAPLAGGGVQVTALAFSPDGKSLASAAWGYDSKKSAELQGVFATSDLKVWDVASGACRRDLRGHVVELRALAFSPDGKALAAGGGSPTRHGEVKLWDVATGAEQASFLGNLPAVLGVAFHPNGRDLVVGCEEGSVYRWSLPPTGTPPLPFALRP